MRVDFIRCGETYDLIFDALGNSSPAHCKKALKKNGRFLSTNSPIRENIHDLLFLKELIEAEKITPVVDRLYPLEHIVEAHRYVDNGHKKGNVVITVEPNDKR